MFAYCGCFRGRPVSAALDQTPPPADKSQEWLTVKQVARRLQIHPNTVYAGVKDRTLCHAAAAATAPASGFAPAGPTSGGRPASTTTRSGSEHGREHHPRRIAKAPHRFHGRGTHRRYQLPCAADLTAPPPLEAALLTLAQAKQILADPMRDMAYLDTRLGPLVAAYIAWKKTGRPAKTTIDTYERILARLAVHLPPGVGVDEFGVAELSLYLDAVPPDSWRLHRTVINGFVEWAIENDYRTAKNPVKRLAKMQPGPSRVITVFSERELDAIVGAARHGRPRPRPRPGVAAGRQWLPQGGAQGVAPPPDRPRPASWSR